MRWYLSGLLVVALVGVGCDSSDRRMSEDETAESETPENAGADESTSGESETMTEETQSAMTPEEALERLEAGNERFVEGESHSRDYGAQVEATADGQYPFAAVLGCIDSRVPPETIFDQGIGDIFTGRVAGNFVNDDMLGSLEFATKVAGSKLIVVLGHTSCGAVKGACDDVEMGHVSKLVTEIRPSVEAVTPEGETCSSDDAKMVNDIARHNVNRTIDEIREKSDVIAQLEEEGTIEIVGAMYDVSSGEVTFMEPMTEEGESESQQ